MSHVPTVDITPSCHARPEHAYPGVSPQILARVLQLWSAKGLEFDGHWKLAVGSMPGFRPLPRLETRSSAPVDLVFLFDQCVIWVKALHAAAVAGKSQGTPGLYPEQWQGLAAVSARLIEQITALRMLALTDLPMPAMQIARSVSEDVDMILVQLARRRLAARFVACRTVTEANEFWRRHIAGGRAFRAVAEKLYDIGLDQSSDTEYGQWRQNVLTVLGAAVHSNALAPPSNDRRSVLANDDSVYFSAFRIHELCAYSQLIAPNLSGTLHSAAERHPAPASQEARLARLAAPLSGVLINQIQTLAWPATS